MRTNSKTFYMTLQQALADVREQLADADPKLKNARVIIWLGYGGGDGVEIEMIGAGFGDEVKVRGRNLGEITEEFLRRSGFDKRQKTLAIGHQTVDGAVAKTLPAEAPAEDPPF